MDGRILSALKVSNFKAFADIQTIPVRPITLIFGPNSAGKSSFIHSLALAHEAELGREKRNLGRLDVHHTDLGGSSVDLGGFRQYVHRGQANRRVEWGAEIDVAQLSGRLAELSGFHISSQSGWNSTTRSVRYQAPSRWLWRSN
jgi:predicted ATPase